MTPITAVLVAATTAAGTPAQTSADVLAAVRELDRLIVNKDAGGMRALLLADFMGAVPTGRAFRRDEYIAFHCRPGEGLVSIEPDAAFEPVVRVFDGRFAVVNRRVDVRSRLPDGREVPKVVQRIEALVRVDGRWRLASGQGTAVQAPSTP